jgi:hypothetical protein
VSANQEFWCGAVSKEQAVLDAERMVKFAAEPVLPGELVKGQIRNASNALQLDYGTVRRAWYGLAGPDIYPVIYNAWARLVELRARTFGANLLCPMPPRGIGWEDKDRVDSGGALQDPPSSNQVGVPIPNDPSGLSTGGPGSRAPDTFSIPRLSPPIRRVVRRDGRTPCIHRFAK